MGQNLDGACISAERRVIVMQRIQAYGLRKARLLLLVCTPADGSQHMA